MGDPVRISGPETLVLVSFIVLWCVIALATRIFFLLVLKNDKYPRAKSRNHKTKTMIVLGSGGHTTEMMNLLSALDRQRYCPRHYVIADTDALSVEKVKQFEEPTTSKSNDFYWTTIFRSRNVHQSYASSVLTTVMAFLRCLPLVYRSRPDVILCNGPGTCVPVVLSAFLLRVFFINTECKLVFVESFCRTETLSLTGKILKYFTNLFVVQWPALADISDRFEYIGNLNFEVQ